MPTYGVTTSGFVLKPFEVIDSSLNALITGAIGVVPVENLLDFLRVIYGALAELWQLAEAVYNTGDPDAVTGTPQDNLNAITGAIRTKAITSKVTLTWTGNPGVVVLDQSRAKTVVSLQPFLSTNVAGAAMVAAAAYIPGGTYAVGDRMTNTSRVYIAATAGTTINNPPTGTDAAWVDGPVTWKYLGDGTGYIDLASAAQFTGPITALSGTVTVRDTFQSGVLGVTNLLDAILGSDRESDPDYRLRRIVELAQPGSGTASAIKAALTPAAVPGITNVTVFQNTTDVTNVDGMPPHTVEVLARGGDTTTIAKIVFANVDGGINTTGNTTVNITDDQGFLQVVKISRPVEKLIYDTLVVTVDASVFPADGVAQIKAAITGYGAALNTGVDARPYQIGRIAGTIGGVLDITSNTIGLAPSPVGTANIAIALRELAVYDSSRIVITTNPGTP